MNNRAFKGFDGCRKKISNPRQLGGIDVLTLSNGRAAGVRAADINTGGGLRFRVVLDRAMDIADAFYDSSSLAWISRGGISRPETRVGMNWLAGFGGGLLATCGLDHVGGPEADKFGTRCLHGDIGSTPAEVESVVQPDLLSENPKMSITGRVLQSSVFGPHIELRRTISCELGCPKILLRDEITNLGNVPAAHMLLYHINLGWPLIDAGTNLIWKGKCKAARDDDPIANLSGGFTVCREPIAEHSGASESVATIEPEADSDGFCRCGARNDSLGLGLEIKFQKDRLPWLINWQHWGDGEYVTALEPATNPPIGQAAARAQNALRFIAPSEKLVYEIEIEVLQY